VLATLPVKGKKRKKAAKGAGGKSKPDASGDQPGSSSDRMTKTKKETHGRQGKRKAATDVNHTKKTSL